MEAEGSNTKSNRANREGHGLRTIRRIRRWLWGATLLIMSMAALSTCDKFDFYGELEAAGQVIEIGPLSLNPELVVVSLNKVVNMEASGGVSPYSFDMFTGSGTVNPVNGVYTAPGVASSDVVRVTDSEGTTALSVIRALSPLNITPGSASLIEGDLVKKTFTGSGGEDTQNYTFTIVSGPGTITPVGPKTADYDPVAAGNAVIQVEDALGSVKEANVTITPPFALRIDPIEETVTVSGIVNFTAFGGTPSYTFSKDSGSGSLTPPPPNPTASYTAPNFAEAAVIRVTDSAGIPNTVTATVFVVAVGPVEISPSSVSIKEGERFTFAVSGGLAPYIFDMKSGKGTVDPVTGFYTAVKKGKDKVRVTDSLGDDDTAAVNVKK